MSGHMVAVEEHPRVASSSRSVPTYGRSGDPEPTIPLHAGFVHLWTARSGDFPVETEELFRSLPEDERLRANGIRAETRRRQFIHGRTLVRSLLARYFGVDAGDQVRLEILAHGKPVARGPAGSGATLSTEIHFNLSHAEEMVAAAFFADGPVGLDLEAVRPIAHADAIARDYFTDNERRWLEAAPDESTRAHAFLSLWTCKEAVAKATGRGISAGWHEFEIARDGRRLRAVPTMATTSAATRRPELSWGDARTDAAGATGDARWGPAGATDGGATDGGATDGGEMDGWTLIHPPVPEGYIATIAVPRPTEVLLFDWPHGRRTT